MIEQIINRLDNENAKKLLTDYIKARLYWHGTDIDDNELRPYYSGYTLFYKHNIAPQLGRDTRTENVTLKDTGAFYDDLDINFDTDEMEVFTNMPYVKGLVEKYGQFLGFSNLDMIKIRNNDSIRDYIYEGVYDYVKNKTDNLW